jgi:hypothetical protein
MEQESTSIQLNYTVSALNFREAQQLQVKWFCTEWVYKTKRNPDESTQYKARLVIQEYENKDFGDTCAAVGKLNTL